MIYLASPEALAGDELLAGVVDELPLEVLSLLESPDVALLLAALSPPDSLFDSLFASVASLLPPLFSARRSVT